jgi:hypothetical protein
MGDKSNDSGRLPGGKKRATLEASERDERKTARRRLRSAYLNIIGENPDIRVGHSISALAMLARIAEAWKQRHLFTVAEVNRLRLLRHKWRKRAAGEDARYNLKGTRRGRPTQHEQDNVMTKTYTCVKGMKMWIEEESLHVDMRRKKPRRDADDDRGVD